MSTVSSISPISPSDPFLLLSRYVIKPVDRIGHILFWGSMTVGVTLGTFQFGLILLEEILPTYSFLWGIGVPVLRTPIGGLLASVVVLLLLNMYCVKKTQRAYHELRVWMVEVHISLPGPRGERQFFTAAFQYLALPWQQVHQEQQSTSSETLSVLSSPETTAATMTVISEDPSHVSDRDAPTERHATGIFGTILSSCQVRVVGPTGKAKVIDLHHRPFLLLWLYLIARMRDAEWVSVADILADVYGYDGAVKDKETGKVHDPRVRLLNRFHDHHRTLRKLINEAFREVGYPKTKILQYKREDKTSYWRLSDSVQIEDLIHFQECEALLEGIKKPHEEAYRAQVKAGCERISGAMTNLSTLLKVDETHEQWIRQLATDAFSIHCNALKFLASESHTEAERALDEEAKRRHTQEAAQYWTTYTLTCARMAGEWSERRRSLIRFGEWGLRKTLPLLHDLERSVTIYDEFKQLVEKGRKQWNPGKTTQAIWQKVLALDEDEAG